MPGLAASSDAFGERVRKNTGGSWRDYIYGPDSNVVAEYGPGCGSSCWLTGYVYMGGQPLAEYNNGTTYFAHKDHLGSTRVLTDVNGSGYDDYDYLPFGELMSGGSGISHKFTGKERDAESNLDYFGARYMTSTLGRFVSPDPLQINAHLENPQTLNRYSYVTNNPTAYVDPNGRDLQKAWQDVKKFASSIYARASIGIGADLKVKVGPAEVGVGAAAKANLETSSEVIAKVSLSAEAGVDAKAGSVKVGESVSSETTVLTVHNDKSVTWLENTQTETVDSLGGHTTTTTNTSDRVGIGVEVGLLEHYGAELGATKEGFAALGDAAREIKNSLTVPTPPPAPPPPQPPVDSPLPKCAKDPCGKKG